MREWSTAQRTLIGALIGLVRALDTSPGRYEALRLITDSLRMLGIADDTALQSQIQAVREEKRHTAPDCSVCKNPCGRTDDYDLSELDWLAPPLPALKYELLDAAIRFAECAVCDEKDFQGVLEVLKEALFSIGYDFFSAEALEEKIAKVKEKSPAQ